MSGFFRKITPVLIVMLLACGCSVFKKSNTSAPAPAVVQESPSFRESQTNEISDTPKPKPETRNKEAESVKNITPRPEITFAVAQCNHVRLPSGSGDFFAGSDEIIIDLDLMASEFCYPLAGKLISNYGMRGRSMHTGIDIKTFAGDTIRAAMDGVVRMSKLYSGYGNVVVIRHYNGLETVYSHNSKNLVGVNDAVQSGQPIALTGRTGTATTEHLHFEIRAAYEHINPNLFVDAENRCLKQGKVYLRLKGSSVIASSTPSGSSETANGVVDKSVVSSKIPAAAAQQSSAKFHIVKSGDTLYGLSRANSTTVAKICALNGIKESKVLQVGEKLRIK